MEDLNFSKEQIPSFSKATDLLILFDSNGKVSQEAAGWDSQGQAFTSQRHYTMTEREMITRKAEIPFLLMPKTISLKEKYRPKPADVGNNYSAFPLVSETSQFTSNEVSQCI